MLTIFEYEETKGIDRKFEFDFDLFEILFEDK
jgi:hypothetical protein